jgi:hypothetical protein
MGPDPKVALITGVGDKKDFTTCSDEVSEILDHLDCLATHDGARIWSDEQDSHAKTLHSHLPGPKNRAVGADQNVATAIRVNSAC